MAHDPTHGESPAASGAPRLVVGLGNPGEQYRDTRHNVGFRVLDELARRHRTAFDRQNCNSLLAELLFAESPDAASPDAASPDAESPGAEAPASERPRLLLVQPQTYMNRSGYALRCLRERYGFAPEDILVVYDEVHLPLGRLRLRPKGRPAGHRGMESVIENLRSQDVARLRCGVGPRSQAQAPDEPVPAESVPAESVPAEELAEFVLEPFHDDEQEAVDEMIQRAADACETWFDAGTERAMNQHNG